MTRATCRARGLYAGADDGGPILDSCMMASGEVVDEIQYRHNRDGVNVGVAVRVD